MIVSVVAKDTPIPVEETQPSDFRCQSGFVSIKKMLNRLYNRLQALLATGAEHSSGAGRRGRTTVISLTTK